MAFGHRTISQPILIFEHLVPPPLFLSVKIIVVVQHVRVSMRKYMCISEKPSCWNVGRHGVRCTSHFQIAVRSVYTSLHPTNGSWTFYFPCILSQDWNFQSLLFWPSEWWWQPALVLECLACKEMASCYISWVSDDGPCPNHEGIVRYTVVKLTPLQGEFSISSVAWIRIDH